MTTNLIDVTDNPDINGLDEVVAKNMAETLHRHYPGQLWAVTCQGEQGIATVRNLKLSGQWGFVIHLRNLFGDPGMVCVKRAGGELLERFRVSRAKREVNEERILELPTLANGCPVFDYAQSKGGKVPDYVKQGYDKVHGGKILVPERFKRRQTAPPSA